MARYMLLLETDEPGEATGWSAWLEELDIGGQLESAEQFLTEGAVVSADEALDVVSGRGYPAAYAIIFADDADAATQIAASYPGLALGAQLTLRRIQDQNYDSEALEDADDPEAELTLDEDDEGFVR